MYIITLGKPTGVRGLALGVLNNFFCSGFSKWNFIASIRKS